jgi:hypothetical protein
VVVEVCRIWAVSRMGKNSSSRFCDCIICAQAGVRLGIVVKEKDVCHVSVRANCTGALCSSLKIAEILWKNSHIIANDIRIIYVNFIVTEITFSEKKWKHYFRGALILGDPGNLCK